MQIVSHKRTIRFVSGVNPETVQKLLNTISELVDEDPEGWISLCITSSGGDVGPGFGFVDTISSICKAKLQTIALGDTASMAVPIFLTGVHRVISPRTTLFLHEPQKTFSNGAFFSPSELRSMTARFEYARKLYAQYVAKRSSGKLTMKTVLGMMKEETSLTPKKAVEFGLAHEISG